MKKLIQKSIFNNLIINNNIDSISSENINEFSIGKNFFYEVKEHPELKALQKNLNKILKNVDLNQAAVGFRDNHSYLHLFEPHKTNYNFLRLDIKSFFCSIQISDIQRTFEYYIEDAYIDKKEKQTISEAFINSVTYTIPKNSKNEKFKGKQVLPMGFITSPIISNIIFRMLDIQIQKLCSQKDITYTRYADDMLFSSQKDFRYVHSDSFINEVKVLLYQKKFYLNYKKTIKSKHTLSLNGYTVQYSEFFKSIFLNQEKLIHELRLSNKKLALIKKTVYKLNNGTEDHIVYSKLFRGDFKFKYKPSYDTSVKFHKDQLLNKLIGYRAYLLSFIKFNKTYMCTKEETIEKYSDLIHQLDEIIEKRT